MTRLLSLVEDQFLPVRAFAGQDFVTCRNQRQGTDDSGSTHRRRANVRPKAVRLAAR